jgi:endonuclease/exonuclease/phosphatase family metal-dependent hydrolase
MKTVITVSSVFRLVLAFLAIFPLTVVGGEGVTTFRLATWNVYDYLTRDRMVQGMWTFQYPKPEVEKTAVREIMHKINADVWALQEFGEWADLRELQRDLRREGLDYPFIYLMEGLDPVRRTAVMSRIEAVEVRAITDLDFPYFGERIGVKRGLHELHFKIKGERWIFFNLHLKSRLTDEREDPRSVIRRTSEARVIRDYIRQTYPPDEVAFVIAGDVNDTAGSAPVRRLTQVSGRTITRRLDAEDSRGHRWTHRFRREDSYTRVDYILPSPAFELRWELMGMAIEDDPRVLVASDHRPVYTDWRLRSPPAAAGRPEE